MERSCVYLQPFAVAYFRAYGDARGGGAMRRLLREVLTLDLLGAHTMGPDLAGIALADAAACRAAWGEDRSERARKAKKRSVNMKGFATIAALKRRARRAGMTASGYLNHRLALRIWGHEEPARLKHVLWSKLSAWVKIDARDGLPVVHVVEEGVGHLSTRKLSAMEQAHAITGPQYIPALIILMALEGRQEARRYGEGDYVTVIRSEWGAHLAVPTGGRFAATLEAWEAVDGSYVSGWLVAYTGGLKPIPVTRAREDAKVWAEDVSRSLNAAWCRLHLSALGAEAVLLDVSETTAALPMAPMEEDDE